MKTTRIRTFLRSPRGLVISAALLIGFGGFAAWRYWGNPASTEYRSAKVEQGPILATTTASGTLNAVVSVQVGSQVSGQIKEVLVDFNSEVKRGQVIARIDPEIFEYRLKQAQADIDAAQAAILVQEANLMSRRAEISRAEVNLAEARRDLARKVELTEKKFISPAEQEKAAALVRTLEEDLKTVRAQMAVTAAQVKNAEANAKQREAASAQARVDLDRTVIRAPINGIVIKRTIEPGQTVAASLQAPELFVIAQNLTDMQVDTAIDEAEIGRIKVGQDATFTVDAFPGRNFSGKVRQVRKAATNVSNVITYIAVVSARNDDLSLFPGMTANVRIVTDRRESALKVPNAALRFKPAGYDEKTAGKTAGMAAVTGATRKAGGDAGATRSPRGRVFVLDAQRQPQALKLQLGLSDGSFTEVVEVSGGELAADAEVLIGTAGGAGAAARGGPRAPF
jgi:HlyD family secretion protein